MERCTACLLPASYPGLQFDENGVCSHCRTQSFRELRGEDKLREVIDSYRGKNDKYDCIVAFSGGRDSSFMLWYAVKKLGLKALAVFVDNGFAPEQTMTNIRNATDALGVDLVIKKHSFVSNCVGETIRSWVRKPSPGMVGLLCAGCVYALRMNLFAAAYEYQIPLMLFGLGEPEPETTFAEKLLMSNPHKKLSKFSLGMGFLSEMLSNPSYALKPVCVSTYTREFIFRWAPPLRKRMMRKFYYPELRIVEPFYYIEWNEDEITSVIHNELNWRKCDYSGSTWRTDCEIATFKNHLYKETLGFSKTDELLSSMIRCGMVTRERALERLETESTISEEFIVEFLGKFGIEHSRFKAALEKYRNSRRRYQ